MADKVKLPDVKRKRRPNVNPANFTVAHVLQEQARERDRKDRSLSAAAKRGYGLLPTSAAALWEAGEWFGSGWFAECAGKVVGPYRSRNEAIKAWREAHPVQARRRVRSSDGAGWLEPDGTRNMCLRQWIRSYRRANRDAPYVEMMVSPRVKRRPILEVPRQGVPLHAY